MNVLVEKTGSETYLHQVIELVRQAQESKSRAQNLADRAAFLLTVIALSVGIATLAAWLYLGEGLAFAIERSVTVMVITCPHALGLAIPLVVAVSTSIAARSGLLIRDRQAFEQARDIQAAVFDKTGTLTEGRFGVTDIIPLSGVDEAELLRRAASLEARAEHPIARAVLESAKTRGIHPAAAERFELIPGQGIEGSVEGRDLKIAGPGYLRARGISIPDQRIEELLGQGKTVVVVLEGDMPIGALALADVIREESREAVHLLKSMNIRCMMLTGDGQAVAGWVAGELGLDEFFAEVLPHEKAAAIKEIQKSYMVAMVGDGVNDAPALAQADVGIAIGAGTDVAIEVSDVILVRNDPREVAHVIKLSRNTYSKMLQNLLWATGYNVIAIPLAAGVLYSQGILLSPAAGAALMSLSTVIVAVNARMLKG
jgi:Cu2+-exporting ATPase